MTLKFTRLLLACCLFALPVFFNSCIKDSCDSSQTYRLYTPVYKTRTEMLAAVKSSDPQDVRQAGKIYIRGNYIFLNDVDRGIHVIDNANPSSPKNIAWIPIPGNMDLAVKGNILYADSYSDLLSIDISDALNVRVAGVKKDAFPSRIYQQIAASANGKVIVDWQYKDTVVPIDCRAGDARAIDWGPTFFAINTSSGAAVQPVSSPAGVGGSMARFTIAAGWLYIVTSSELHSYDLTDPAEPQKKNSVFVNSGVETIYPFRDELFLGTQTGMFRFDISKPGEPEANGMFGHLTFCDPVIADEHHAFVTLRSGSACQGFSNQLDIVDLDSTYQHNQFKLLVSHPMTNPHGLGKAGDILFICDGKAGLKVYNVADIYHPVLLKTVPMVAYDVIVMDGYALAVASDGLYQFSYTSGKDLLQLSKFDIN